MRLKVLNYFLIWFFRLELRAATTTTTTTTKIKTTQINMQISVLFIENIPKSGNGRQEERQRERRVGRAYAARAFVVSLSNIYNAWQVLAIDFARNSPRESIWKCDRILNLCQVRIIF